MCRIDKFEIDDVSRRKRDADNHAADRARLVHPFGKDTHHNRREERARGEPKGERHYLPDEPRRVYPEIAGDANSETCGDTRRD